MNKVLDCLLNEEPWVEYRTRLDLLGEKEGEPLVVKAREKIVAHPKILSLFDDIAKWTGAVVNSHKKADLPMHRLSFLADIGLTRDEPRLEQICAGILEQVSGEGVVRVLMNIPRHFGGSGENQWAWALCDAPVVLYSLVKMGFGEHPAVISSIRHLKNQIRDNGWPCAVSPELGKFRGPGRKEDPCPYATLAMLKLLIQADNQPIGEEGRIAAESLLQLWENSKESHPYMFYMGTDFRKLKAPFIWYDLLHLTEVLTQLPWLKSDRRLGEMTSIIKSKEDDQGLYTPESMWMAWKGWDFGQKKVPSPWMTFLIKRMLKRMD